MKTATVGFRVKTGWAAVALVADAATCPTLLDVTRVELYDPSVKDSGWPYHAGLELEEKEARKVIARLVGVVERISRRALGDLLRQYSSEVGDLAGAGIVVGSQVDPATIKNDHIRAHAEEGRLYRSVVLEATTSFGLEASVLLEKEVYAEAAAAFRKPVPRLKKEVTALGREIAGEWRSVQKEAVLAAMLVANAEWRASRRRPS